MRQQPQFELEINGESVIEKFLGTGVYSGSWRQWIMLHEVA
jgi:hypothetical protein